MLFNIFHSFVNIFAGGRSEIKTIIFLVYILFLSAIYLTFKNLHLKNFKWRFFCIPILFIYIYGFLLHLIYLLSNNLKITDYVITGNYGSISSSVFYHTHIAKSIIGEFFNLFNKNDFQTTDAGSAYLGFFQSPIFIFGLLVLLTLILEAVYYFISSFRLFLINKNIRQKIFLILGYAIISFSMIKTSIDGGILNPSFILGVIFILVYIFEEKGKLNINYNYYLVAGFSALFISIYFSLTPYNEIILNISSAISLLLLYIFILYGTQKKVNLLFLVSFFIIFMLGWWQASVRDRDVNDYSNLILQKGQEIYIYNDKSKEVDSLIIDEFKTVSLLSKQLNKNITYMPISIPGISCLEKTKHQNISTVLITNIPIHSNTFTPSRFIEIKSQDSIYVNGNWKTAIKIIINPCTPELLSTIDGYLQNSDINNYLMVNPSFYDTTFSN
jgi:hypothetical protein